MNCEPEPVSKSTYVNVVNKVIGPEIKHYSRVDKAKALIGTGLGVGGCLGFSLAFAINGSLPWAAAMLIAGGLGVYASKINLEDVYNRKK